MSLSPKRTLSPLKFKKNTAIEHKTTRLWFKQWVWIIKLPATECLQFAPGWVLANSSQVMCKTQQGDNDALFLLRITESHVRRPRLELSPLSDLWIAHASVFSKWSHFWSINQILLFARVRELKRHYRSWNSNNTFKRFREIRAFMG